MIEDFFIEKTFILTNEFSHVKSIDKNILENSFVVVNDIAGNYKGIFSSIDLIKKPHNIVGDCISKRPEIDSNEILENILDIFDINSYNEFPVFERGNFIGVICKKKIITYFKKNYLNKKIKKTDLNSLGNPVDYKELYKLKIKLFSIISHDLKDPFNTVLGFSSFILENYNSLHPTELKEHIQKIYNSSYKNYQLTQNLLTWSLKQQKGFQVNKEFCNLNEIIENPINILIPIAQQKNIKILKNLNLEYKDNGYFDKDIIFNVLYNIISNSIKYSKENSLIEIKTYADEQFVYIETKDNGIGISNEKLQKLNQNNNANEFTFVKDNNEYQGGFGLTYAKELVNLYGGQLVFDAVLEKSTTVLFYFPISSALTQQIKKFIT